MIIVLFLSFYCKSFDQHHQPHILNELQKCRIDFKLQPRFVLDYKIIEWICVPFLWVKVHVVDVMFLLI